MNYKQVIAVRRDLKMPPGKLAAQVGHAVAIAFFEDYNPLHERWRGWRRDGQTKIVVGIDDLEHLLQLMERANRAGIRAYWVRDEGRTVFHGEPTITCASFGPATDEQLKPITGDLKLL